MIQFPCHCGHAFVFDDDQAGGVVQCPDCRVLNDIPLAGDLANLSDDGTFKISEASARTSEGRLGTLGHVFGKRRTDAAGNDIDLRNSQEDLEHVGEFDLKPADPGGAPRRPAPKYDPETGELIREIPLAPDELRDTPPDAIPMARPAIGYVSRRPPAEDRRVSPGMVPAELFRPVNLFVMSTVVLAHVALNIVLITVVAGIPILFIVPFILIFLILAHYGTIVDEIGPSDFDELPRPLRNIAWHDDLWGPFSATAGALILCYWPVVLLLVEAISAPWTLPLAALAWLAGSIAFPGVYLTIATSGTMLNLRPDRIRGVIARCGVEYWATVAFFVPAALTYMTGVIVTLYATIRFLGIGVIAGWPTFGVFGSGLFGYAMILTGIYLMHLFCWRLGLLYRRHQPEFPWVLQHHHRKTPSAGTPRRGRRPGAAGLPPPVGVEAAASIDAKIAAARERRQSQTAPVRPTQRI